MISQHFIIICSRYKFILDANVFFQGIKLFLINSVNDHEDVCGVWVCRFFGEVQGWIVGKGDIVLVTHNGGVNWRAERRSLDCSQASLQTYKCDPMGIHWRAISVRLHLLFVFGFMAGFQKAGGKILNFRRGLYQRESEFDVRDT